MHVETSSVHAAAPLRISFVGGGTDFPHWFTEHGGAVLSATIDHHVRVAIWPRADRQVRVRSLDLGHLVEYHLDEGPVYDGVMDLAKAAIVRVGVAGGIDMAIQSDAPPGSGLGGSSALVTAVVAGLLGLDGRRPRADALARLAYTIERDDVGITGGWQDQYAAAFGGLNLIEFAASGARVEPVAAPEDAVAELEGNLLLCYTGSLRRNVGLVQRQIELHREGREETLLGMKHLQAMAYEMRDALVEGEPDALGAMLRHAFEAKKQMNPHIAEHTPIEAMLDAAAEAGAIGGKICGAGGGGYVLIYCRPHAQPSVRTALEALGGQFASFRFQAEGVRVLRGSHSWGPSG